MALGSNRDYVKTHKSTMKNLINIHPPKKWKCSCGRTNYWYKDEKCPRCQELRSEEKIIDNEIS